MNLFLGKILIDNGWSVENLFDDNSINLCLVDNFSIFSCSQQTCHYAFQRILTFIKLGVFIVARVSLQIDKIKKESFIILKLLLF
jgi:hypothetical protein